MILFQHSVGLKKKTAWAIWRSLSPLDQIFTRLSHAPKQIFTEDLKQLEIMCVVFLHQRPPPPPPSRVNDSRKIMFTQNRRIDNIPPTLHALEQQMKRDAYQAGHTWDQSLIGNPELPPPHMWSWQRETDDTT